MKISALTYAMAANPPKEVPKVPPSLGIRAIPSRVVGFYGFKPSREGIAAAMREAAHNDKPFHRIEMEVDVGEPNNTARTGLDNVARMRFVNFALCKVDLINEVLEIIGGREGSIKEALSRHPEAINRLWKHPRYAKVYVFVSDLDVKHKTGMYHTRVAFIRSPNLIGRIIVTS